MLIFEPKKYNDKSTYLVNFTYSNYFYFINNKLGLRYDGKYLI